MSVTNHRHSETVGIRDLTDAELDHVAGGATTVTGVIGGVIGGVESIVSTIIPQEASAISQLFSPILSTLGG